MKNQHFYRPARAGDVQNAGASIVFYERWRETGDGQLLQDIQDYNRDDVDSTQQLRDWLLTLRPTGIPWLSDAAEGQGGAGDADVGAGAGEVTKTQEAEQRLARYRVRLVDALPADPESWSLSEQASGLTWQ